MERTPAPHLKYIQETGILVGKEHISIYTDSGFFGTQFSTLLDTHRHLHTEIHLILSGQAEFVTDSLTTTLSQGDMIVIPAGQMHCSRSLEDHTERIAFMISKQIPELFLCHPGNHICALLSAELVHYMQKGLSQRMGALLSLLCSELPDLDAFAPETVQDRHLLIDEFFSNHFAENVSLQDIAGILNVSPKQAQRLIHLYTGRSFRSELVHRRMEAAAFLMSSTSLSLERIAEQVGYQSYSGFWKAFNKQDGTITRVF